MPALPDHSEHRPEETCQEPTICQKQIQVFLDIRRSIADAHKDAIDSTQHCEIHKCNAEQEDGRHQSADHSTEATEGIHTLLEYKSCRCNHYLPNEHDC